MLDPMHGHFTKLLCCMAPQNFIQDIRACQTKEQVRGVERERAVGYEWLESQLKLCDLCLRRRSAAWTRSW